MCFVGSFFLEELLRQLYNDRVCILNHHLLDLASNFYFDFILTFLVWKESLFLIRKQYLTSPTGIGNYRLTVFSTKNWYMISFESLTVEMAVFSCTYI